MHARWTLSKEQQCRRLQPGRCECRSSKGLPAAQQRHTKWSLTGLCIWYCDAHLDAEIGVSRFVQPGWWIERGQAGGDRECRQGRGEEMEEREAREERKRGRKGRREAHVEPVWRVTEVMRLRSLEKGMTCTIWWLCCTGCTSTPSLLHSSSSAHSVRLPTFTKPPTHVRMHLGFAAHTGGTSDPAMVTSTTACHVALVRLRCAALIFM